MVLSTRLFLVLSEKMGDMKSIWGVDHGIFVSKSYIPGRGWVPAMQAGKQALRGAKGGHQAAKGVSNRDKLFRATDAARKEYSSGSLGPGKKATMGIGRGRGVSATVHKVPESMGQMQAAAFMTGKNRRHMILGPMAQDPSNKALVRHELAHLAPKKRTAYRLDTIMRDPKKLMREEARADTLGGLGNWRDKSNLNKLQSGYGRAARSSTDGMLRSSQEKSMRRAGTAMARAEGASEKKIKRDLAITPSRANMYGKKPLAAYRHVQDKMTGNSGPVSMMRADRDDTWALKRYRRSLREQ